MERPEKPPNLESIGFSCTITLGLSELIQTNHEHLFLIHKFQIFAPYREAPFGGSHLFLSCLGAAKCCFPGLVKKPCWEKQECSKAAEPFIANRIRPRGECARNSCLGQTGVSMSSLSPVTPRAGKSIYMRGSTGGISSF